MLTTLFQESGKELALVERNTGKQDSCQTFDIMQRTVLFIIKNISIIYCFFGVSRLLGGHHEIALSMSTVLLVDIEKGEGRCPP